MGNNETKRAVRIVAAIAVGAGLGVVLGVTAPRATGDRPSRATASAPARTPSSPARSSATRAGSGAASRPAASQPWPGPELTTACDETRNALRRRAGTGLRMQVSVPFVIAGDLSAAELDRMVRHTIRPAAEALWAKYFDKRPAAPITILLFSGRESYEAYAKKLFGDTSVPHFGYYRPGDRTLVMDINTGTGTLVHELVHALAAFDFPQQPTWFSEGLASLYEQCTVGPGEIRGLVNWRLPALKAALKDGSLRPLSALITADDFRGPLEGLNYAHARYLCMYLQSQDRLERYYERFRSNIEQDRMGLHSLEAVFDGRSINAIDRDFRRWVAALPDP